MSFHVLWFSWDIMPLPTLGSNIFFCTDRTKFKVQLIIGVWCTGAELVLCACFSSCGFSVPGFPKKHIKRKFTAFCFRPNIFSSGLLRFLPSNSKLPSVRRASVMLPTSLASGMLVRLGEASWWARPLGMPGWRSGLCINTRESIFSRPSWMSFFSWGIWRLRSYSTAVSAGLNGQGHN